MAGSLAPFIKIISYSGMVMKKAIVTVELESSLGLVDLLDLVKKAILSAKLEKEGFLKVVQIQGNRIK